jgi:hypothetical protein
MPSTTEANLARYEVRAAEVAFPSITWTVAANLTREDAEDRATKTASWQAQTPGCEWIVSVYDTVTRTTVKTITDPPPVVYAVWPKKVRRARTTKAAA